MERIKLWQLTQYLEDKDGFEGGLVNIMVEGEKHDTEIFVWSELFKSIYKEWEICDIEVMGDPVVRDCGRLKITVRKADKADNMNN